MVIVLAGGSFLENSAANRICLPRFRVLLIFRSGRVRMRDPPLLDKFLDPGSYKYDRAPLKIGGH